MWPKCSSEETVTGCKFQMLLCVPLHLSESGSHIIINVPEVANRSSWQILEKLDVMFPSFGVNAAFTTPFP